MHVWMSSEPQVANEGQMLENEWNICHKIGKMRFPVEREEAEKSALFDNCSLSVDDRSPLNNNGHGRCPSSAGGDELRSKRNKNTPLGRSGARGNKSALWRH